MAKSVCPKCEHDKFEMGDSGYKDLKILQCEKCKEIIGTVDDIDFRKKFDLISTNQVGLERCITSKSEEIKSRIEEIDEKNDKQIEYLDAIYQLLRKSIK